MGRYNQPESELVAALGTLVPQPPLRHQRAGPSAEQFQSMQLRLGRSPRFFLSPPFVARIGPVGESAQDQAISADPAKTEVLPVQSQDR